MFKLVWIGSGQNGSPVEFDRPLEQSACRSSVIFLNPLHVQALRILIGRPCGLRSRFVGSG
ncbi:MAG TPA: hypothetical protein DDZ51_06960 [Planctomycetaceae bacterium]|nr:hypothetical protein [Planctomycetaceae bacterium]